MLRWLCVLLLCVASASARPFGGVTTAQTFNYYIAASSCSDSNSGTVASPWCITSLQSGSSNQTAIAQHRVGLLPGTYSMSALTGDGNYEDPLLNIPAGVSGTPTYVGSSDSSGHYSARTATLDLTGYTGANTIIGQNNGGSGYWTVDGIVINGEGTGSSGSQAPRLIAWYASTTNGGVTIENSEFYGLNGGSTCSGNCALIYQNTAADTCCVYGTLIKNNYLHNITSSTPDHTHGFEDYWSQGTQIIDNTFANMTEAIDGKEGDSNDTIANNYFYNMSSSSGVTIRGYDGATSNPNSTTLPAATVDHNVFDSVGQILRGGDVNSSYTTQPDIWYNNTAYLTQSGSFVGMDLRGNSTYGVVTQYNNIFDYTANTGGGSYGGLALTSGQVTQSDYSDYYLHTNTGGWGLSGTLYNTLSAWTTASTYDAHSTTGNPTFSTTIVPGNGPTQFQLGSGSAAMGTGMGGDNMGAWDTGTTQIGASWAPYPLPSS